MKVQVSISGFSGTPSTLICGIDDATGLLLIARLGEFEESRRDGFALVANTNLPAYDYLFDDTKLRPSIDSYHHRLAKNLIRITDGLQRCKPDNRIERVSVNESGSIYQISPDIENCQIAVLAAVSYASQHDNVSAALDALDDLLSPESF